MARATRTTKAAMDGAQYWSKEATPALYMNGPDGLRPNEKVEPKGDMTTYLDNGTGYAPLPPRSIWRTGKWKQSSGSYESVNYRTWVVSGEGTPGNFLTRYYVVPAEAAADQVCKHPADWPKKLQNKPTETQTQSKTVSKAAALPVGIRFRCPGCGHWYKEFDLSGHAKVCPGQDGENDWAIECECCHSLDDTAKCKPGFPRPKPVAAEPEKPKAEAKPKAAPKPKPVKEEVVPDGGGTQAA